MPVKVRPDFVFHWNLELILKDGEEGGKGRSQFSTEFSPFLGPVASFQYSGVTVTGYSR
jgi:hypothetical protein